MKFLPIFISFLFVAIYANGQGSGEYFYHGNRSAWSLYGNPGHLNKDYEPLYMEDLPTGWQEVTMPADSQWTGLQNIPIPFKWRGSVVSNLKIHTRGFVCFGRANKIPVIKNVNLPHSSIPDSSFAIWGMKPGKFSRLLTKVFGQAPKRQFWIQFNHFGSKNLQQSFLNSGAQHETWAVVLEEGTNAIFAVTQSTFGGEVKNNLHTIGLQFNQNQAFMAPDTSNCYNGGGVPSFNDNQYFGFFPGPLIGQRVKIAKLYSSTVVTQAKNGPISIMITFMGNQPIDSIEYWYKEDNKTPFYRKRQADYNGKLPVWSIQNPQNWYIDTLQEGFHTLRAWVKVVGDNSPITDTAIHTFYKTRATGVRRLMLVTWTSQFCPGCPPATSYWNSLYSIASPFSSWAKFSVRIGPDPFVIPKHQVRVSAGQGSTGAPAGGFEGGFAYSIVGGNQLPTVAQVQAAANKGAFATLSGKVLIDTTNLEYRIDLRIKSQVPSFDNTNFRLLAMFVQRKITIDGHDMLRTETNSVRDIFGMGTGYQLPPLLVNTPQDFSFTSKFAYRNNSMGRDSLGKWNTMFCILRVFDYMGSVGLQAIELTPVFVNNVTDNHALEKQESLIELWPNPTNSELYISIPSISGKKKAILYSTVGERVGEFELDNDLESISVAHLRPGLYHLRIGNETKKFLKE